MSDQPPREPIGNTEFHVWCRDMVRFVKRLKLVSAPNGKVNRTPEGTFIVPDAGGGAAPTVPATIYACRVALVTAPSGSTPATSTYLTVTCINPDAKPTGFVMINNSPTIKVGIPPILRTNPAPAQGAIIWPPYALNDEILVTLADGYGLASPLLRDNQGNPILYVQIPDDRGWCIKTDFCSNGQFVKRWLRCSGDNAAP